MNFYLSKNDQKLGPYSVEQIQIFLKQGLVTTTDQIWADGWASWMPINNVPGLGAPQSPEQSWLLMLTKFMAAGFLLVFLGFAGGKVLVVLAGAFSHTNSGSIIAALQEDTQLGNDYKTRMANLKAEGDAPDEFCDKKAQLIRELITNMRNIDTSHCPTDFREAYTKHIQCWSDYAEAYANHPHVTGDEEGAFGELLIAAVGGDAGNEVDYMSNVAQQNNSYLNDLKERTHALSSSWDEVQNIAAQYGVKPADYSSN